MQIVIDIPDEKYEEIMLYTQYSTPVELTHFEEVVKNGTPIPKGHGRLIDAELLDKKRIDYIVDGYANDADDCAEFGMMIILAPTIIEADGGDAE